MRDAFDNKGSKRRFHRLYGLVSPCFRPGTDLGDHRIIEHADFAAFIDAGVDQHVLQVFRFQIARDAAGGRQKSALRVFGVDARFHRPAIKFYIFLRKCQMLAGCDIQHLLHEVDAGDKLGDAVLHLQARIHL